MTKNEINEFVKLLDDIKESGVTIDQYLKDNNLDRGLVFNTVKKVKADDTIDSDDKNKILERYKSLMQPKIITNNDIEDTDDRAEINLVRDNDGKIQKYTFKIYKRDRAPLVGSLTREEMCMIYSLYSSYGANLSQRVVSRDFPEYSLCDFKRIIRAFNITKASAPFPPHIMEEHSDEEIHSMEYRQRENNLLKKSEASRNKDTESLLNKCIKEKLELQHQLETLEGINLNLNIPSVPKNILDENDFRIDGNTLIIWLADMHVGCKVDSIALYPNPYNEKVIRERFTTIINKVNNLYDKEGINKIIVCNLGDSLDGMDMQTARRDHMLPQNMNNIEQLEIFVQETFSFIAALDKISGGNTEYYCVGDSNHDGCYGRAANRILERSLTSIGVSAYVSDQFMDIFIEKGISYIFTHGKDSIDMKNGFPTTLDTKTEDKINNFIDHNELHGKITVVKGDTHQSATTYGKRFKYKCAGAFVGSTKWSAINFGPTPAVCDYTIVSEEGDETDGRIMLN